MEHEGWKRDENPYVIFSCSKCKQYMYVKTTQKTKKCLRCGRQHKVSSIISSGEIVKGMTTAVASVKKLQNELAIQKLGTSPELRAADDFTVKSQPISHISFEFHDDDDDKDDLSTKFEKILVEISDSYNRFPYYVLEIMADNYGIPRLELKLLVKAYQKKGILIQKNSQFKIELINKKN
ncbi:MAG: DUF1922 domain-containing protein [Promethearchaeota archaeon]|jgi:hypothetical protein